MFTCVLGRWVASTVILVPKPFGGRRQLRGDKVCPFSGVTKSGRVWRKVPESDARSRTPSIVLPHLPPHSARIAYATEGALYLSPSSERVGYQ